MSPTQRTLQALRKRGYFAEVVERWNPHARIRRDLYRWVDIVAVKAGEPILGVQTTTMSNAAARLSKAMGNQALACWLNAGGRLAVFAWAKRKRRLTAGGWSARPVWELSELPVNLVDVEGPGSVSTPIPVSGPAQEMTFDALVELGRRDPGAFYKLWAETLLQETASEEGASGIRPHSRGINNAV